MGTSTGISWLGSLSDKTDEQANQRRQTGETGSTELHYTIIYEYNLVRVYSLEGD
jgi:hypothetical protein